MENKLSGREIKEVQEVQDNKQRREVAATQLRQHMLDAVNADMSFVGLEMRVCDDGRVRLHDTESGDILETN